MTRWLNLFVKHTKKVCVIFYKKEWTSGMAASTLQSKPNPYPVWYWDDRNGGRHGPHNSETAALLEMLVHVSEEEEWRRRKVKSKPLSKDG